MNIFATVALAYGIFRLVLWLGQPNGEPQNLLLALMFVCLGATNFISSQKYYPIILGIRYIFGLFCAGFAYYFEQNLFMWLIAIFVIITAITDTLWLDAKSA